MNSNIKVSNESLPNHSSLLRFHKNDNVEYFSSVVIAHLTNNECELKGFVYDGDNLTKVFKSALIECAKQGYNHCYVERRKNGRRNLKKISLKRYYKNEH